MLGRTVLTTWQAGRYCGVNPYTVRNWVEKGILRAYTTPGGHRRIRREDLDAFLVQYGMPAPEDFLPGGRRVLLMEADPAARRRHRNLLGSFSAEMDLRAAEDSFAAGALLYAFAPHLVIFDLDDASLDWVHACATLHHSPDLARIKLAGATRRATVEMVERAQRVGMVEVLVKPLEPSAVRALLKTVFPYLELAAVPAAPRKRRAKTSR
jgi:excisionase family DNA binding protein